MKDERLNAVADSYKLEQKGSEERVFCTVKMMSVAYFYLVFVAGGVLILCRLLMIKGTIKYLFEGNDG